MNKAEEGSGAGGGAHHGDQTHIDGRMTGGSTDFFKSFSSPERSPTALLPKNGPRRYDQDY